jgi:hypothetical protein
LLALADANHPELVDELEEEVARIDPLYDG